jgi:hypothetical protein
MELPASSYVKNVNVEQWLDLASENERARARKGTQARVKWLGTTPEEGPWVYWVEQPKGAIVHPHKHFAPRIEYLVEGALEYFEGQDAIDWIRNPEGHHGARHETGAMSYVPAGTLYGYYMLEDSKLLHVFFSNPVGHTEHLD